MELQFCVWSYNQSEFEYWTIPSRLIPREEIVEVEVAESSMVEHCNSPDYWPYTSPATQNSMGLAWCCRFLSFLSREAWFEALRVVLQNNPMHWKGSFKETLKHTIHLSWILTVMLEMLTTCWGHIFVKERPDYEVLTILDRERAKDQAAWTIICNLTSRMSMCQPCSWFITLNIFDTISSKLILWCELQQWYYHTSMHWDHLVVSLKLLCGLYEVLLSVGTDVWSLVFRV